MFQSSIFNTLHQNLLNSECNYSSNLNYTQLVFGLVIVVSVVLQTIIERKVRRQSITGR